MTNNEIIKFLQSKQIPQFGDKVYTADEEYEAYQRAIDALERQPCDDAISRKVVVQTLNKMDRYTATELTLCDTDKKFPANEVFIVDDVYEQITEHLPSVTPQQKYGKWIDGKCNKCGTHAPFWAMATTYYCSKYCPNCGAKMQESEEV